jgi:nucleoside-diphosphate-sugar epimerase
MTRQATAFAREHRLSITILEPVWVYGEREFNTGFYSYVKAVQSGANWMPGSVRNLFHVVYARDLANAYVLAARKKLAGIERMIIGDPSPVPMRRVFDLFCEEAGLRPPHRLCRCTAYLAGFGMELYGALTRSTAPPLLTRGRVDMFYDSIQFSTAKAQRVLGFSSSYSIEQGIRKTVEWYKMNHFL